MTELVNQSAGPAVDAEPAGATALLSGLGHQATGEDYFFLGDAYRQDGHPDLAVPLLNTAISLLKDDATDRIAAARGVGYAEALLNQPSSSELLARFDERAPGYDAANRFFQEDFDELRAAAYLGLAIPADFGGPG